MSLQAVEADPVPPLNLRVVADTFGPESRLGSIRDFWAGLCRGEALPRRRDFDFCDLARWLGWIALVDTDRERRDFTWRLIGTKITERLGRDMTGCRFRELYEEPVLERLLALYRQSLQSRRPVFLEGDFRYLRLAYRQFQAVHLPLVGTGPDADMILVCMDFEGPLRPED